MRRGAAWMLGLWLAGCGDDGGPRIDAAVDGAVDGAIDAGEIALDGGSAPPDLPWLPGCVPPMAPPALTPCPVEWREVASDPPACEPYPAAGPAECDDGEAHFPGEPGCTPIGATCPAGEWADGLPASDVLFVRPGATGGDGSRTMPFGTIAAAMDAASEGAVIALSRGLFLEPVVMRPGVTLRGACVRDTQLGASSGEAVVLVEVPGVGVRDLTIADSARVGVLVRGASAAVTLQGVVVSAAVQAGLLADGGARITATSIAVRDTATTPDGSTGYGVMLLPGSTAVVTRALFERNRVFTLFVANAGASLELADAAVRDTLERQSDGGLGRGLHVQSGGTATATRVLFERNREVAVFAGGTGSRLTLVDAVVRDTRSQASDGTLGRGLQLQQGASADVSRVLFERNRDAAIVSAHDGTTLTLADAVVRDTDEPEAGDEGGGQGLRVAVGGSAEVSRIVLVRNRDSGVLVDGIDASLRLSDAVVRGTLSRTVDEAGGRGLTVLAGASVELSRALIEDNRDIGLLAAGEGATVTATEVSVIGTLCAGPACPEGGHGVVSAGGAALTLRRFKIATSARCGVLVAGPLDLMTGLVADNDTGVCLQLAGFDVARLTDDVLYRGNSSLVEATAFPVPP